MSVSALVLDYLRNLVADRAVRTADKGLDVEAEAERRRRMLWEVVEKVTAKGGGLRMADNLSREELYDRARARARAEAQAAALDERQDLKGGARWRRLSTWSL